jgi:hypothetical protein
VVHSTGPPGDRGTLHCRWNIIATHPIGLVSFQARGILPVAEEQSRTRGSQGSGVEDQPQCRGMCHSSRPSARSLSRSSSPPPPSFTQSLLPHLVSHNRFIIGTAVINTHTRARLSDPRRRRRRRLPGSGLVYGSGIVSGSICTSIVSLAGFRVFLVL